MTSAGAEPAGRAVGRAQLGAARVPRPSGRRARSRPQHLVVLPPRPAALPAVPGGIGRTAVGDITATDVSDYLATLRMGSDGHPALAASSAARAVVAARGWHRFLLAEGAVGADASRDVRPPAPARRLPKALPVDTVTALLDAASGTDPRGLRDRALLELLYATGARISEAVGLDVDDVDDLGRTVDGPGGSRWCRSCGCAARDPRSDWCRSGPTRSRPCRPILCAAGPPRRGRPQGRPAGERCSSTTAAAGCPGRAPGRCCRTPPSGPASGSGTTFRRHLAAHSAALLRHPSAGGRRRRPVGPGTARARLGHHHADLHAGHGRIAARGLRDLAPAGSVGAPGDRCFFGCLTTSRPADAVGRPEQP